MTTYPDALAACVARFGEPSWRGDVGGTAYAEWADGVALTCLSIAARGDAVWMDASTGHGCDRVGATWMLAGEPCAAAPLTPLPAALDAADAWRRP